MLLSRLKRQDSNIGGYAWNLESARLRASSGLIWPVSTSQVVRCISACIYAAFRLASSPLSSRRQITRILFSCLKSTKAVILRIPDYRTASVIRQSAGIPGIDSGYPYSLPVRLMLTQLLNISFSPLMQSLLFISADLSLHFQILKDDDIYLINFSCPHLYTNTNFRAFLISEFPEVLYHITFPAPCRI